MIDIAAPSPPPEKPRAADRRHRFPCKVPDLRAEAGSRLPSDFGALQFSRYSIPIFVKFTALFCLVAGYAIPCYPAPHIPANDTDVLEYVPRRDDPTYQELQHLRRQLAADPVNLPIAVALARRYIDIWRMGGDPRYLGYAQAALGPWWKLPHPPADAQVMRAILLQSTHQFSAALSDLDAVLQDDPGNAQAWLTRATILQVLGKYQQAKISCAHLYRKARALITQTCLASIGSLTGQAERSYQQLNAALRADKDADAGIRIWVLTLLAEMSVRRGDMAAARDHFQQALSMATPDNYLLAAYADFLLDQHQPRKVAALLESRTQVDALLLRYALALKALHSSETPKHRALLMQRFEAARMRGDTIHQREQARFELELLNDPAEALKVAQQNWSVQKEPADTLLLLKSAAAVNDKQAARPVLEWLKQTGLEDRALVPLLAQLGQ
jgi:Tfp pilus assembly protein PilF